MTRNGRLIEVDGPGGKIKFDIAPGGAGVGPDMQPDGAGIF